MLTFVNQNQYIYLPLLFSIILNDGNQNYKKGVTLSYTSYYYGVG